MLPLPTDFLDGIRYYDQASQAQKSPCVLIHGLGSSLDSWTAVAPILTEARRTVALDLPGFGLSRALGRRRDLRQLAAVCNDFMQRIRVRDCVLVGHSLGAIVALQMAELEPAKFVRVILVGGNLISAIEVLTSWRKRVTNPTLAVAIAAQSVGALVPFSPRRAFRIARSPLFRRLTLWPFVASTADVDAELLARALSHNAGRNVLRTLAAVGTADVVSLLSNVSIPIDLVWGSRDRLLSTRDVARTKELTTVDRELEIPRCGHWPMVEFPELLADFINEYSKWDADWLRRHEPNQSLAKCSANGHGAQCVAFGIQPRSIRVQPNLPTTQVEGCQAAYVVDIVVGLHWSTTRAERNTRHRLS